MRKIARLGGIGYLIIFFTGIFANFTVLEAFKVKGDALATYQNFADQPNLVLLAFIAFVVMVIFDGILTGVLYVLFKNEQPKRSKITAWLRAINVVFFAAALYYLVDILFLISEQPVATLQSANELVLGLESFNAIWLVGLAFFGAHLILLSCLLKKSRRVFKMVPPLLFIAGVGYLLDTALQFGYADYARIAEFSALIVVLPGIVGELSLTGWLLFKAEKNKKAARIKRAATV